MRKFICCGSVIAGMAMWLLCAAEPQSGEVQRGRYLVDDVAKCGDCHTPRLDNGELDKTQMLKGAMLDFAPSHPIPHWKAMAPDITPGGQVWKRGEPALTKFLETAVWPDGDRADPPMPDFKLSPEDAKAVVAYLKTLK